ncbi:MAG: STAS domain-containing protein [Pseudomonadota bacterium]
MITAGNKIGDIRIVVPGMARLDASVADRFKSDVKELIDAGDRYLVVDFSGVQFMDSSGLGALVGCLKYMGKGGKIEIACPCDAVMKVLRLTRMNKVFSIRDALPQAA